MWCLGGSFPAVGSTAQVRWNAASFAHRGWEACMVVVWLWVEHSLESSCLWVQLKVGGKLHLKLNMATRPIANKYREGKLKRTLKREFKSAWNCSEVNGWNKLWIIGYSLGFKMFTEILSGNWSRACSSLCRVGSHMVSWITSLLPCHCHSQLGL